MMSNYIKHVGCNKCGSSDGLALYEGEEGLNGYCWVCHTYFPKIENGEPVEITKTEEGPKVNIESLPIKEIGQRGISKETAEKYEVRTEFDTATGTPKAWYFPVRRKGGVTGWEARLADTKVYYSIGDTRGDVEL